MKNLIWILTLLLTCQIQANDEKIIHGFCVDQPVSLEEMRRYLHPISLPNDQLDMIGHCVEVLVSDGRATLYETFLQRKFRLIRTYTSGSGNSKNLSSDPQDNCRLEVLKKRNLQRKKDELAIGSRGKLKRTEEELEGDTRSQLLLTKGTPGMLRLDNEVVYLTCAGGNNGNYTLTVTLDSPDSGISTSVSTTQGVAINIGSIAKDLSNKGRKLSIASGVDYQKNTGSDNYEFFLTVL